MKLIIFVCLIAVAAAGILPSAPIAYSSPLAYSTGLSPALSYSGIYNTPLAYNAYNAPLLRSSFGYPSVAPLAPVAYSAAASPYYRNPFIRSFPYYY